jgi:type IV secretory pathway TraG/TraD family ATPase VirD4
MIVVGHDPSSGQLVTVSDEDACLVCGMPRSGKTRGIVVPSVLAHQGPCLVTSTKYDVLAATIDVRAEDGPIWVFSTDGRLPIVPGVDVRLATWTPIPTCADFDQALLHARAMVGATIAGENVGDQFFWYHHAERLLAAIMHAAAVGQRTLVDVAAWVLTGNLEQPTDTLRQHKAGWAMSIVEAIDTGHERFRDSVLATTSEVLRVFDHSFARALASADSFPVDEFLDSNGILYICVPSEQQDMFAPLVVGLIEDILMNKFRRADRGAPGATLGLFLDELRRVAPIHNLPGYLAEAGSHGVQILGVLQDLSQARERWGAHVAEGFLTLFRSKILLPGVLDRQLLENLSQLLGDDIWATATGTMTVRPIWSPHALSNPEPGHAVHIDSSTAAIVQLTMAPTDKGQP